MLSKLKAEHESNPDSATMAKNKHTLLRALFTVGLFCKHFDFDAGIKHSKVRSVRHAQEGFCCVV